MSNKSFPQRKRSLSFHEKQNRFFAVSLVSLAAVAFGVFLWVVNRTSLH